MKSELARVAVLIDTSTSWGRRIIQGINAYNRQHGCWQIFIETRGEGEALRLPDGWSGDGVIALVNSAPMARHLEKSRLPVVNVSGIKLRRHRFTTVTIDMPALLKRAADHLLERGFKHFGYYSQIALPYVSTQYSRLVYYLRQTGHACALYPTKPSKDWQQDIIGLANWLNQLPKPVGVFTWNACSGRQLIQACARAGLQVPEDVAVLSNTDDDILCELADVPISGVAVDAEKIGYEAAAILNRHFRTNLPMPEEPVLIPPRGVNTRKSTDILAVQEKSLATALQFIRSHAADPIQVQDVLTQVPTSRRSLERIFLKVLGRTPAAEIRRVHFERAKALLQDTDISIPGVADASGFGSPEYMAYVFKHELNQSPLQYRKRSRTL